MLFHFLFPKKRDGFFFFLFFWQRSKHVFSRSFISSNFISPPDLTTECKVREAFLSQ